MTTRDSHIGSHCQHRLSDQVSANTHNLYVQPDLSGANLTRAGVRGGHLRRSILNVAGLSRASLNNAELYLANLARADLSGTNFSGAVLVETILAGVDLTCTLGLDKCFHAGPSVVDFRTLSRSRD